MHAHLLVALLGIAPVIGATDAPLVALVDPAEEESGAEPGADPAADSAVPSGVRDVVPTGDDAALPSKKDRFLQDKSTRGDVRARRPLALLARPAITLRNQWTHDVVAVDLPPPSALVQARAAPSATRAAPPPSVPVPPAPAGPVVDNLLRDHFTNQSTRMDDRLADVVLRAAAHFNSTLVEVVSGFRSPKYNLMLRKKGHAVARDSQHPQGNAVDFRLAGVPTAQLYKFVRSLRVGGVGYYPHSGFVHADVGPIRVWRGN